MTYVRNTLLPLFIIIALINIVFRSPAPAGAMMYSQTSKNTPWPWYTPPLTQERYYNNSQALLIQDKNPWFADANIDALDAVVGTFDIVNSAHLSALNLSKYRFILIASDQTSTTYTNINANMEKITDFVSKGGVLVVHAASDGWNDGNWENMQLPGGTTQHVAYINDLVLKDSNHPIIKGYPATQDEITSDPYYFRWWEYGAHGYFTNLPSNTQVIISDNNNNPVFIDYPFGAGKVIATTQTLEWKYKQWDMFEGEYFSYSRWELLWNEISYAKDYQPLPGTISIDIPSISLNGDGWYTQNPVEVTVTITNAKDTAFREGSVVLYVSDTTRMVIGDSKSVYKPDDHKNNFKIFLPDLAPHEERKEKWKLWLQPSPAKTMVVKATLYGAWGIFGETFEVQKILSIPTAHIKPVVVVPGLVGSMRDGNGQWVIEPIYGYYNNLLNELRLAGYEDNKTLFTFPHDWRKDIVQNGKLLERKITSIKSQLSTTPTPYVNNEKVDLIGHSMGGLVARSYIQNAWYPGYSGAVPHYNNDVGKMIFIGTPHQGAPIIYPTVEGADLGNGFMDSVKESFLRDAANKKGYCTKTFNLVWGMQICRVTDKDIYNYIRNEVPSVRQLLPVKSLSPAYLQSESNNEYPYGRPENLFLESLNGNVKLLADKLGGENVIAIVGQQPQNITPSILRVVSRRESDSPLWQYGKVTDRLVGEGDDTVPTINADITNLDARNSKEIKKYIEGKEGDDNYKIEHVLFPTHTQKTTVSKLTGGQVFFDSGYNEPHFPKGALMITNLCPVELLVTDKEGRKTGYDPETKTVLTEIPGAVVSKSEDETEPETIFLPEATTDTYTIKAYGKQNGDYSIFVDALTDQGTVRLNEFHGLSVPEQIYTHTFTPPVVLPTLPKEISFQWINTDDKKEKELKLGHKIPFEFKLNDNNNNVITDENVEVLITKDGEKETAITMFNVAKEKPKGKIDYLEITKNQTYYLDFTSKWYNLKNDTVYNLYVIYHGDQIGKTTFNFPSKENKK